jgi:hypothetical protein
LRREEEEVEPALAMVRIPIMIDGYAAWKEIFVVLIHFYLTNWNCVKTNFPRVAIHY